MKYKLIKGKILRTVIMLVLVASVSISLGTPAYAAKNVTTGFSPDIESMFDAYVDAYGWDSSLLDSYIIGQNSNDGITFEMQRRAGFQMQFMKDNIETTKKYLGMSTGSSSGSGQNIVEVALNEVGADGSVEIPDGSNNVKYNTWYYGREVSDGDGYAPYPYYWCCVFIAWCAEQCGYIDSELFQRTASCALMYSYMTRTNGFESYNTTDTTPMGGSEYTPVPGDLVFFYDPSAKDGSTYTHIGLVVNCDEENIYTVEGNSGNAVRECTYPRNPAGKRADFYRGWIVHVEYPDTTEQNQRRIFDFLLNEMGLNSAAACGVLANIENESGFNPTRIEDKYTVGDELGDGYGLCQWTGPRRIGLQDWCDANGYDYTTLEGQLWFLKHELETSYKKSVYDKLLSVTNDAQGAYQAGYIWCYSYEICRDYKTVSVTRGNVAKNSYWPIFGEYSAE